MLNSSTSSDEAEGHILLCKQYMWFVCTRVQTVSAYGLGQCQLGFGMWSVLGKKWEAPASPDLSSYLQCV